MTRGSQLPLEPGIHDVTVAISADQSLKVTISVPAQKTAGAPFVLVLHYGGQPTGHYGRPLIEFLLEPAFSELGAVIAAPVSLGGDWGTSANIDAVLALSDLVESSYATDPARRVISGYSLGAIGTWHLLSIKPAYFSAAIPIAGFKTIEADAVQTPVLAFHSNADELFPIEDLVAMVARLNEAGADVTLETVDGVGHYDITGFAETLQQCKTWLQRRWAGNGENGDQQ